MKKEVDYQCPNCGKTNKINIYPVINLQSDKDLYSDLFSLDLFRITCKHCKKNSIIQYDTFIVDMYKKYMIFLCINENINNVNINNLIASIQKNNEYKKVWEELRYSRIVSSLNELLEKLLIFDYDLNDKILEMLKQTLFDENRLDKDLYTSVCFNKIDRDSLLFSCFNINDNQVQPIDVSVDMKYYNLLIDKVGGIPEETTYFEYIDKNWVTELIMFKNKYIQ